MRTRTSPSDPVILAGYWFLRFAEAVDAGDGIMAAAARGRLAELGFDVSPCRPRP
jgi:hypothetical protein